MNWNWKQVNTLLIMALAITLITGCRKDSQTDKDSAVIQAYLDSHPEINAKRHSSGIYYQILEPGSGGSPTLTSTVTVTYKGYLTNGEVFDGGTTSFRLLDVIKGWQISVPLLKKGGNGIFIIPSELGYGGNKVGNIPANSVLIFEISLLDF